MKNDGKYDTDFFFLNTVIYNMKVLHFEHSYTLKGYGIVLSQIHAIQYSREVKGMGMGSDKLPSIYKNTSQIQVLPRSTNIMLIGMQKH
jgi:hypothetical protein